MDLAPYQLALERAQLPTVRCLRLVNAIAISLAHYNYHAARLQQKPLTLVFKAISGSHVDFVLWESTQARGSYRFWLNDEHIEGAGLQRFDALTGRPVPSDRIDQLLARNALIALASLESQVARAAAGYKPPQLPSI